MSLETVSQRVFIRCKPVSSGTPAWKTGEEGKSIHLSGESSCTYGVSRVAASDATHEEFFNDTVADWVSEALEGRGLTILSYGPHMSGKTFSSFGTPSVGQFHMKSEARGIATRCIDQLLKKTQEKELACRITGSFCHVFPDGRVADLLNTNKKSLQVIERAAGDSGIYDVDGATRQPLTSTQEAVALVEKGLLRRNIGGIVRQPGVKHSPSYRPHSSHAVLQYSVEAAGPNASTVATAMITIIDLAGQHLETYHQQSVCPDAGLQSLHFTLSELEQKNVQKASEYCLSTPLTRLLYSSIFGRNHFVLLVGLIQDIKSIPLSKSCFEFADRVRHCKNSSKSIKTPAADSALGQTLSKIQALRSFVATQCNVDGAMESWESSGGGSVTINGTLYNEFNPSTLQSLNDIASLEREIIQPGHRPMPPTQTPAIPL